MRGRTGFQCHFVARFFEPAGIDRSLPDGALSLLWLLAVSCSPRDLLLPISKLLLSASLYYRTLLDHQYEWSWFQRRKDHLEVPRSRFQIEVPGSLTGLVRPPIYVWPVLPLTILSPSTVKSVQISPICFKGAHPMSYTLWVRGGPDRDGSKAKNG